MVMFPEFTKLTLSNKEEYRRLVKDYPPVSDLSFSTLMIWWNFEDSAAISRIDNNLVINYELPGDEKNSGLGFVGVHNVDESINKIFSNLVSLGKKPRLVHVPQFVIDAMQHTENYIIQEELDYNEYIYPTDQMYPLDNLRHATRRKIKHFLNATQDCSVDVREIDVSLEKNKDLLLSKAKQWWKLRSHNDEEGAELHALRVALEQSETLELKNLCLFINDELHGFQIYQVTHDNQYIILNHQKVSHDFKYMVDYLTYETAGEAVRLGVPYANLEMDLGIPGLRTHKMELKPLTFFKKYTVMSLQNQ